MKVFLIDVNPMLTKYWFKHFSSEPDVSIVPSEFAAFMATTQVDCVVSPDNAYGLMDGDFDTAITDWYGDGLRKRVQQYIIDHYRGEQPVGTSFIIEAGRDGQRLIHTPTMRTPQKIRNPLVLYQCMRTTLMTALDNDVGSIVIPAFGAGGRVSANTIADMMHRAWVQIHNPPASIDLEYVMSEHIEIS